MKVSVLAVAALVAGLFATGAMAQGTPDKVTTSDGSTLNGTFSGVSGGKIGFTESAAGEIKLDPAKVQSLTLGSQRSVWYQPTKHDRLSRGTIRGGRMTDRGFVFDAVEDGGADLDPLATYKLAFEEYSLWNFSGFAGASALYTDGNSDELNYGANLSLKWEHPVHIFEILGSANFGKKAGIRSTQRARLDLNYTWRFSDKLGAFARQSFEHNHFQSLRVRSITSAGVRAFLHDDAKTTVTGDVGASYIEEHFKNGTPSRDYTAAMFALDATHRFTDVTVGVAGVRNTTSFEEPEVAIVNAYAGVNTTLMAGMTAGLRLEWDWVARPGAGAERTDTRLSFLLGWTFA